LALPPVCASYAGEQYSRNFTTSDRGHIMQKLSSALHIRTCLDDIDPVTRGLAPRVHLLAKRWIAVTSRAMMLEEYQRDAL